MSHPTVSESDIREFLADFVACSIGAERSEVDCSLPLFSLGLSSLDSVALAKAASGYVGVPVSPTAAWDYPTIDALVGHCSARAQAQRESPHVEVRAEVDQIAIVGLGCRFPGADGPEAYFDLLIRGEDPVGPVPVTRWDAQSYFSPDISAPAKMVSQRGGFLSGLDHFDAAFFRISPREAAHLDPRQRLMLEIAWEAFEDAGIPALQLAGTDTGVFVATLASNYGSLLFDRHLELVEAYSGTGNGNSVTANRLSYFFDLHGPSLAVDTACSGSLVAMHLACNSLLAGESRLALAGGVNVILKPDDSVFFSKTGALSPEGICRVFDRRANGIVRSEGAGCVVLKRLSDALADGDRIHAVVRATAVNQDGATNGLMAPSGLAQQALLRQAYERAGLSPNQVQYIEAHGTGTALGDPIEVAALASVLCEQRAPDRPCALGSVKSNIGHTEAASGMAGLIKTTLALERRVLPGNLHFEEPNPLIQFGDAGRLVVQQRSGPWPRETERLVAGVSAFGFAGTNAHVVLSEAPPAAGAPRPFPESSQLLLVSARSEPALQALARSYADQLAGNADAAAVCRAAATQRSHLELRLAVTGKDGSALAEALGKALVSAGTAAGARRSSAPVRPDRKPQVALVFSGQGSHWPRMGRQLFAHRRVFREVIEACDAQFAAASGRSLIAELARGTSDSRLDDTDVAQPAVFAVQAALAALWRSFGLEPAAIIGQSVGELTAAHAAGALSLEHAFGIVCLRSRLMKRLAGQGLTAAIGSPAEQVAATLAKDWPELSIAGRISATLTLVSGQTAAMRDWIAGQTACGQFVRLLAVELALHGPQMEPLRDEMLAGLAHIDAKPARMPLYMSLTGARVDGSELGPEYWWRNLRQPFDFAGAFGQLQAAGSTAFVEVSPHPMLVPALMPTLGARPGMVCVGSMRRQTDETLALHEALATLYAAGCQLDWQRVFDGRGPVLALPHYPWQRERFWFDQLMDPAGAERASRAAAASPSGAHAAPSHPLLGEQLLLGTGGRERIFQVVLPSPRLALLGDHRVQGSVVLPAAAYAELGLAAWRSLQPQAGACRIESLLFCAGLVLQGESRLQTIVEPDATGASLRIVSARPGSADWTVHARGRLVAGVPAPSGSAAQPPAEQCASLQPMSIESHYQALAELGLDYGAGFRTLSGIWQGLGLALGRIERSSESSTGWLCHPALLDACLQLAAAAAAQGGPDAGALRLPTALQSFDCFVSALPERFWCQARLHEGWQADGDRLLADLTLIADDGTLLALASGASFERVGSPAQALRDNPRQWLYRPQWRAAAHDAALLPAPASVAAAFEDGAGALADELQLSHHARQWEPFDRLCAAYAWQAVGELGLSCAAGAQLAGDEAAARAGIAAQHRRYWQRLLAMLRDDGLLDAQGRAGDARPVAQPDAIAALIADRFPQAAAELALVQRGGSRLAALLRGEVEALEILFAYEGDDQLERLYRDSVFMRWYNAALRRALEAALEQAREQPLRILEIGAGTGSTTQHLLPALAGKACDYVFTDISPRFVEQARARFATQPGMQFCVFDIERNEGSLPGAGERFDIVVAANVLHATADLRRTLAHVRQQLRPGGWLLLLEGAGPQRWLDLIVGGTDGWWRFDDTLRSSHALVAPATWAHALAEAGFDEAVPIVDPTPRPPQFVMLARAAATAARADSLRWLLLGPAPGLREPLAALLREAGAECHAIDPATPEMAGLPSLLATPGSAWRVLVLPGSQSSAEPSVQALDAAESGPLFGAIQIVQQLAHSTAVLRLWFVTQGAQPAGETAPVALLQSPLWGIGRVVATEHPEFWGGLVDLGRPGHDGVQSAELRALLREVLSGSAEDQVALRGSERFVARLVHHRSSAPAHEVLALRSDGCYLVTGGLRGIGLAVAERLVERGARHLVLLARTCLPPRQAWLALQPGDPGEPEVQAVRRLESQGAAVHLASFDLADDGKLADWLATWRQEGRPLVRGVVHSAGLIQDHLITQMTRDSFAEVLRPKVRGAWLLHEAFAGEPLDFFVLFSSGTSLLGTFGQANYAAANAFIDALAHHRRASGQAATAINWGVWGGIGIVARMGGEAQLAQNGLIEIRPALGLDALELLLRENAVQVAAMPTDWTAWRRIFPKGHERPYFADLLDLRGTSPAAGAPSSGTSAPGSLLALRAAPPQQRLALARLYLAEVIGAALRLAPVELTDDVALPALGLDSIMAIEIRNRLQGEAGLTVSIIELLQGATVQTLAQRLAESLDGSAQVQPSAPADAIAPLAVRSGLLPCSPAQEALWTFEKVNDTRVPMYNIAVMVTLASRIAPDTLRRALAILVARHEPLRTVFAEVDGRPRLRIAEQAEAAFEAVDLSGLPPAEQGLEAERRTAVLARRPFTLDETSLARFALLQMHDSAHFVLSVHHLVFDGWSAGVLVRDLALCVQALEQNRAPTLAPLPIGFADYAAWLRNMPQAVLDTQLAHWQGVLDGWPSLELPLDVPRRARPTYRGAKVYFELAPALAEQVRQLALQANATPFMVFAAAFGAVLHAESAQRRLLLCTTPSQRERPELADLIGYFVNILPLPLQMAPEQPFTAVLAGVRASTLDTFGNQAVQFDQIQRALRTNRGQPAPELRAVLTLQNSPLQLPPIVNAYRTLDNDTAKFELVLNLVDHAGRHGGWWEYQSDLFRPETIARISKRFLRILERAAADPSQRLAQLIDVPEETAALVPDFRLPALHAQHSLDG